MVENSSILLNLDFEEECTAPSLPVPNIDKNVLNNIYFFVCRMEGGGDPKEIPL